ncbi:hypothetical protein KR054_001351 [Drosophila jambulina]|nr:hypothetical protein KR054_001351 [Drosophila jambulina]
MNLCWLWLFWLTLLTVSSGSNNYDLSTLEVSSGQLSNEHSSGLRIYSTATDNDQFLAAQQQSGASSEDSSFLGTTLFQGPRKECFTLSEIALLRARQGFELLVPKSYPKYLASNSIAHMLVRYWSVVNQVMYRMSDERTARLLEVAFYDTLGAYLHFYLMPVAQVSFYAGRVTLNTVQHLMNIQRECHSVLRTNGMGWRMPDIMNITERLRGMKIKPVKLGIVEGRATEDGSNICDELDQSFILQKSSEHSQMLLPLPNLEPVDANGHLTNIYLPFRENRVYSLRSPRSAVELKRFLGTIKACHSYMAISPARYNHKLLIWLQEFLPQHLADDQFYPGLGGILQIQESLLKETKDKDKDKDIDSGKQGRSIGLWEGGAAKDRDHPYMDERVFVAASIVLTAVFFLVVCVLHCSRLSAEKKDEQNPSIGPDDVELGEVFAMSQHKPNPKRAKKEKKVFIETPRSPLRVASGRRYYGHRTRSVSSDDCSTSTLGYQLKQKIMPFSFEIPIERIRRNYKYSPLSSQRSDLVHKDKKKSGHGK